MMTVREKTCCFTGHRLISDEGKKNLGRLLEETVCDLIGEGICYFETGGALGFDTLSAETVLRMRARFPHIRLILVLPCRDQTKGWRDADVNRYHRIMIQADHVIYTAERYTPGCMPRRNRRLVEDSSVCVAYCVRASGGSAYTVGYARRRGLKLIFLN